VAITEAVTLQSSFIEKASQMDDGAQLALGAIKQSNSNVFKFIELTKSASRIQQGHFNLILELQILSFMEQYLVLSSESKPL